MAGSIAQWDLKNSLQELPSGARVEDFVAWDTNLAPIKHTRAAFPKTEIVNPELIFEFVVPTIYGGATGFTVIFHYYVELPVIAGAIIWELAAQRCRSANADSLVNADSWGTAATSSADTVPTTAGEFKKVSMALVKANVGGAGTPVAGDVLRIRLRRMNGNASDTCLAPVYVIGSLDIQDT